MTKTSKSGRQAVNAMPGDGAAEHAPLQQAGGASSEDWNELLAIQAMEALWPTDLAPEDVEEYEQAIAAGLAGIAPRDELEGMMAVQLIAAHNASLASYRRAMNDIRSSVGWRDAITQANSLSRTFATLFDALHRYRGKNQQKITVEHVHRSSEGMQADLSNALARGHAQPQAATRMISLEGGARDSEEQPHAR